VHAQSPEHSTHIVGAMSDHARSQPEDGDPRFTWLVAAIAGRLRPVCAEWDEARFQALVLEIARTKTRWGELDRIIGQRGD
jgi:hypothetical protein